MRDCLADTFITCVLSYCSNAQEFGVITSTHVCPFIDEGTRNDSAVNLEPKTILFDVLRTSTFQLELSSYVLTSCTNEMVFSL